MNELFEIYKRIEYLRNNGVKMKEIADHTQMAASVLSSLYSSVLPTFIGEVTANQWCDYEVKLSLIRLPFTCCKNVTCYRIKGQ